MKTGQKSDNYFPFLGGHGREGDSGGHGEAASKAALAGAILQPPQYPQRWHPPIPSPQRARRIPQRTRRKGDLDGLGRRNVRQFP